MDYISTKGQIKKELCMIVAGVGEMQTYGFVNKVLEIILRDLSLSPLCSIVGCPDYNGGAEVVVKSAKTVGKSFWLRSDQLEETKFDIKILAESYGLEEIKLVKMEVETL